MLFAVIPAAGQSRRMGRPKLSLPLHGRPILAHTIDAFRQAGVASVVVVLGPHVPELSEITRAAGGEPVLLRESTPDMRTTIQHGLDWAEFELNPTSTDAFLLAPGDQVTLTSEIVRLMVGHWNDSTRTKTILIPKTESDRGHPCVIGWEHVHGIRALSPDVGLNTYLRAHEAETGLIRVEGTAILGDMDTPEDYDRLLGRSPKPGNSC